MFRQPLLVHTAIQPPHLILTVWVNTCFVKVKGRAHSVFRWRDQAVEAVSGRYHGEEAVCSRVVNVSCEDIEERDEL